MTVAEFKAWLRDYNEAIGGPPSDAQWAVIKEKINEVQLYTYWPDLMRRPRTAKP